MTLLPVSLNKTTILPFDGTTSVVYSRRLGSAKLKTSLSFLRWHPKKSIVSISVSGGGPKHTPNGRSRTYNNNFFNRNVFTRSKFSLNKFSRLVGLQSVNLKRQPAVSARIGRFIRLVRATPFMRRQ
jgi:hypothetical protein